MKTNQIMVRQMGNLEVHQRTKDGYFNATVLLKQWNKLNGTKKEIASFLKMDQTKAFLEVLVNEEGLNTAKSPYLATRGKQGGTWMHPILYIKFAMWINPRFEYFALKFIHDQLIEVRRSAGDNYIGLTSALGRYNDTDYAKVAQALNYIVFGRHQSGIRNFATQSQLEELDRLQQQFAFAIDMGLIRSFDQLLDKLREVYNQKHRAIA